MDNRIVAHPVLQVPDKKKISFTFDGKALTGLEGEMISSALFAHGIRVFGTHPADGSPQGIFCANGQCSQCTVIADGLPVKACMFPVAEGMAIKPFSALPELPDVPPIASQGESPETVKAKVLIVGGGPSGLSAALELSTLGIEVLLIDDKNELGGKLVLQTHCFFGSVEHCHAGTRGIEIARMLSKEVASRANIRVMLETSLVGVYSDNKVGLHARGRYFLAAPDKILFACGAREKSLAFPGCDLPGVYGGGAFQTLVNRDLVRSSERIFIIGGGNVGLIAGYHAVQAGMTVVGLCEVLPEIGGYKVHADKLKRLGTPIYTGHTVVSVNGSGKAESVTIAPVDPKFKPDLSKCRTFAVDTVLVAVGLSPINELSQQARAAGFDVFCAGDAQEIAEASAAMFSGKIEGRKIAASFDVNAPIPESWQPTLDILKSRPGRTIAPPPLPTGLRTFPVIRCIQEIPCDPCVHACRNKSIRLAGKDIMACPGFEGECDGCLRCVSACPALAITMVTVPENPSEPAKVTVPLELLPDAFVEGTEIETVDADGNFVCKAKIARVLGKKSKEKRLLLQMLVPADKAALIAGIKVQPDEALKPSSTGKCPSFTPDDTVVCRCERIKAGQIRAVIRAGAKDLNQIKAVLRCGMGACGGKTCQNLIYRIFSEEGLPAKTVTDLTSRPLMYEIPLGDFIPGGK